MTYNKFLAENIQTSHHRLHPANRSDFPHIRPSSTFYLYFLFLSVHGTGLLETTGGKVIEKKEER